MSSLEDKLISMLAIAAVGWLLLGLLGLHAKVPGKPAAILTPAEQEAKVHTIAEAIAMAEGYYATGEHDRHSLPYLLNNPGSLKKPALGAEDLPTWKDTGLVIFPSEDMGWAALRHQIELMLDGDSSIYSPSDTLLLVASKYADGDLNWGRHVASTLGVSPDSTLADIGEHLTLTVPGPEQTPMIKPAQLTSVSSPAK